jgi:Recombinase zinc beta ribbon domain
VRIIAQPLWDAAHERLERSRQLFLTRRAASGQLNGSASKVEGGLASKYMLSGFLVCGACGGRMMINKRTSKKGRPIPYYICSTHRTRAAACSVSASLRASEAHERVTKLFLTEVLTPAALQQAVDAMVKKGSEADLIAAQKAPHVAELARLDREISNFTMALGAGGPRPDAVLAAIAEREAARKKVVKDLAALDAQEKAARDFDQGAAEKRLREELKTWRAMLERDPEHARVALRQLLHGPIQAHYRAETGTWTLAGLATLGGVVNVVLGVPVTSPDELATYNDFIVNTLHKLLAASPEALAALHARGAEISATSDVQSPSRPRGDSNTRHAV